MAYIVADRIKETTTTQGTGAISLAGAVSGYRSFASQLSIGDTCAYAIVSATGLEWEVGIGTYSATNTLARTTVQSSTNSNAVVNFSAGTKDVFICPTAGSLLDYDPITHKISDATTIDFNDGSATTLAAGRMWYNGSTGSWNMGMGGGNITQQVGEEIFVYGKASAVITDSPLQIIYQTGTVGASGVITFGPTVAGITSGDLVIGVATEPIVHNGFGRVTSFGVVRNITTNGTAYGETWADGDMIYYNPVTGNPTNIKPVAPNIKVSVGTLIKAGAGGSGSIQVEINHGSVLGGTDSNVQITSPVDGQILKYDGVAQVWENAAASVDLATGVTGILPVANGGTGVTTATGTGSVVLSNTPTLVTPKTNSIAAVPVVSGAGNNLTLAAGSGVGTGAGGSLILQAGIQATSGGDGKVVVKQVAGQTSNLQEWQDSNGTVIGAINVNGNIITKLGTLLDGCIFVYSGSATNGDVIFGTKLSSGTPKYLCGFSGVTIKNDAYYRWSSANDAISTADLYLYRDAAGTLAQRNGTNPQSFRVYNTYTDASNYERLGITWATNTCTIASENAGTGSKRDVKLEGLNITVNCTGSGYISVTKSGGTLFTINNGSYAITCAGAYGIASGTDFRLGDASNKRALIWQSGTSLIDDAANIIGIRNGTNAQTYRVYNTYTDASNYERTSIAWSSNVCYLKTENLGTGLARLLVPVTGATTVALLPSASTAGTGARSFVTDATATTFLSIVAGGGSNKVPVVSDGTNWLIG